MSPVLAEIKNAQPKMTVQLSKFVAKKGMPQKEFVKPQPIALAKYSVKPKMIVQTVKNAKMAVV